MSAQYDQWVKEYDEECKAFWAQFQPVDSALMLNRVEDRLIDHHNGAASFTAILDVTRYDRHDALNLPAYQWRHAIYVRWTDGQTAPRTECFDAWASTPELAQQEAQRQFDQWGRRMEAIDGAPVRMAAVS